MARSDDRPSALLPRPEGRELWLAAVALFGVGDLATTGAGLALGASELNPLPNLVIQRHGFASIVVLKAASLGGCRALWRLVPRPHRLGVPLGLSVVGATVTAWNLFVVVVALLA